MQTAPWCLCGECQTHSPLIDEHAIASVAGSHLKDMLGQHESMSIYTYDDVDALEQHNVAEANHAPRLIISSLTVNSMRSNPLERSIR